MTKIGAIVAIAGGAAVVAGGAGYLVGKAHSGKELKKVTNERDQYKAALDQKKQAIDKPAEKEGEATADGAKHHRVRDHNPPLNDVANERLRRHINGAQRRIVTDPDLTKHADRNTRAARLKAYSEQFANAVEEAPEPSPPDDPPVIDESPKECTREDYENNWSANTHGADYWYYCDDQTLVDQYEGEVIIDPDKLLGDTVWTKLTGCISSDDIPEQSLYVHDPVSDTYMEIDLIDGAFADEADTIR